MFRLSMKLFGFALLATLVAGCNCCGYQSHCGPVDSCCSGDYGGGWFSDHNVSTCSLCSYEPSYSGHGGNSSCGGCGTASSIPSTQHGCSTCGVQPAHQGCSTCGANGGNSGIQSQHHGCAACGTGSSTAPIESPMYEGEVVPGTTPETPGAPVQAPPAEESGATGQNALTPVEPQKLGSTNLMIPAFPERHSARQVHWVPSEL